MICNKSSTGIFSLLKGLRNVPSALARESGVVVAVSIFAPAIINKTLIVLMKAIFSPSSVIINGPV